MRKITTILALLLTQACSNDKLKYIGQEVVDGKVSAIKDGYWNGRVIARPAVFVQTPTRTEKVYIPSEYEGKWKVGDSCLLIIEKYKEVE